MSDYNKFNKGNERKEAVGRKILFVASNLGKTRLGHFWFRSTLVLIDTLVI